MRTNLANRVLLLSIAAVAGLVIAGCKPQNLVSTSDEVAVGREASAQVEQQYKVSTDPRLNQLVNTIGNNLLSHIDVRQGITYTFKVLDTNDINAFSLPGGWVYVEKGLIDATNGDVNELAGVMAHEIGHVQARHAAKQMGQQEIYGVAIGTLTKGNATQWASVFANLNLLHYSREDEYEADKLGIDYTCRSQYNPEGLINFFQVLQTKVKEGGTPSFLRTHPITENRIERAQAYLNQKRASGQCK